MKRFSDLKVDDELICFCAYSSLCLVHITFKITRIEEKIIKGIFDGYTYYFYIKSLDDIINQTYVTLFDTTGERNYDFKCIRVFDNIIDCKKYALKYAINKIREQEVLLNEIICW